MKKGSFLYSVVKEKCPRCNEGDLFVSKNRYSLRNIGGMPDHCPVCGQDYKMEDGFFLGATYISYAITVAVTVPILAAAYWLFKLDYMDLLPLFVVLLVLLMPFVLRVSRVVWFNFFVQYDKDWQHNIYRPRSVKDSEIIKPS